MSASPLNQLFTTNGLPLCFYIPPCKEKHDAALTIRNGGGVVQSSWNINLITLVQVTKDFEFQGNNPIFNIEWVFDSAKAESLLPLADYQIKSKTSQDSPVRTKYTEEDNQTILKYLETSTDSPNGEKVWKVRYRGQFLKIESGYGKGENT
jgi:hypothetical protein